MRIGFTGTRSVRVQDLRTIQHIVDALPLDVTVVTGGCFGVDACVARMARRRELTVLTIMPSNRSQVDPGWLDMCTVFEEMPKGSSYRDRNQRIVDLSDRMVAITEFQEDHVRSLRSGTWMTVRLTKRIGKPLKVVKLRAQHDDAGIYWLESVPSGLRWFCYTCEGVLTNSGLHELDWDEAERVFPHEIACPYAYLRRSRS